MDAQQHTHQPRRRNAPRFSQCVLHIGTEKTGSTSLQNALAINRAVLAQRGIFVPASLSPYPASANHERLTTYALADAKLADDLRVSARVTSPDALAAHRTAVAQALRDELAALPQDATAPRTLLLSNEHCHSRLIEVAEVARLCNFLAEFAGHLRVIVYLRPQHELAVSLYDQALKAGYADIPILPDFAPGAPRWVERIYFDYASLLDRWAAVAGAENIEVRIFAKSELTNGSVVDDVMRRLGIDPAALTMPPNSNTSLDAPRQVALNAINRLARASGASLPPELRASLIAQFQRLSAGRGLRPARRSAALFYHQFALGNEEVRARFLPGRDHLFMPDFSAYPDRDDAANQAAALARTVLDQQAAINALRAKLPSG